MTSQEPEEMINRSQPRNTGPMLIALLFALSAVTRGDDQNDADVHWAFRNFETIDVPTVAAPDGARTPIDAFLLKQLSPHQLSFSEDADRETLIRRVYLDLLGIPPDKRAVDAFLSDHRANAYEILLDRLLASPHFGERWGRHWLDVSGYTDTVGFDVDPNLIIIPSGKWRYRHYVIDALNADKPFDEFVRQQLAGDERVDWRNAKHYDASIRENLIATGFLRTAADFTHEPESFIRSNMYAVLYDTMEIVGTSLLGLTLQCARCHDHKFDAVSQRDYYQLMACFTPAYNPDNWKAVYPWKADIVERGIPDASPAQLAEIAASNEQLAQRRAALESQLSEARERVRVTATKDILAERRANFARRQPSPPQAPPLNDLTLWLRADANVFTDIQGTDDAKIDDRVASWRSYAVEGTPHVAIQETSSARPTLIDSFGTNGARALRFDRANANHLRIKDAPSLRASDDVVTLFLVYRLNAMPPGDVQLITKYIDGPHVGSWGTDLFFADGHERASPRIYFANPERQGQYGGGYAGKQTLADLSPHQLTYVFDNGEVRIRVDGKPVETMPAGHKPFHRFRRDPVEILIAARGQGDRPGVFFPGDIAEILIYDSAVEPKRIAATEDYLAGKYGVYAPLTSLADAGVHLAKDDEIKRLENELRHLPKPRQPSRIQALYDVGPPPETRLLESGDFRSPADPVDVGFLSVLKGTPPQNTESDVSSRRRTALARWLTTKGGRSAALMGRVLVNRVWQHVFGTGIVITPENFGVNGAPPSHPELLEWLAADTVENGWQTKRLLRQIMMSSVYRQSSSISPEQSLAQMIDPTNRLLWRMPLRRLEGEVIRDCLLAVSGRLNRTMGGPPIQLMARADSLVVIDRSKLAHPSDQWRRSVYLLTRRAFNHSLLTAFDQPSIATTCPQRTPSAVVSQSLMMSNGDLIIALAGNFADRVMAESDADSESRIQTAYRLAFARRPSTAELSTCSSYLAHLTETFANMSMDDKAADLAAFKQLCLTLLNTSEFLYSE